MIKRAFIFSIALNMTVLCIDDPGENPVLPLVMLRSSHVLPKDKVDSINIDLIYLQQYHDALYDLLCDVLARASSIDAAPDVSLLKELRLIDEYNCIKDDVGMVLAARLLDSDSNHPSPYEMLMPDHVIDLRNNDDDFDPER